MQGFMCAFDNPARKPFNTVTTPEEMLRGGSAPAAVPRKPDTDLKPEGRKLTYDLGFDPPRSQGI